MFPSFADEATPVVADENEAGDAHDATRLLLACDTLAATSTSRSGSCRACRSCAGRAMGKERKNRGAFEGKEGFEKRASDRCEKAGGGGRSCQCEIDEGDDELLLRAHEPQPLVDLTAAAISSRDGGVCAKGEPTITNTRMHLGGESHSEKVDQCTINGAECLGGVTENVAQPMRGNTSFDGESKSIGANPKGSKWVQGSNGNSCNKADITDNKNCIINKKTELLSSIV